MTTGAGSLIPGEDENDDPGMETGAGLETTGTGVMVGVGAGGMMLVAGVETAGTGIGAGAEAGGLNPAGTAPGLVAVGSCVLVKEAGLAGGPAGAAAGAVPPLSVAGAAVPPSEAGAAPPADEAAVPPPVAEPVSPVAGFPSVAGALPPPAPPEPAAWPCDAPLWLSPGAPCGAPCWPLPEDVPCGVLCWPPP